VAIHASVAVVVRRAGLTSPAVVVDAVPAPRVLPPDGESLLLLWL